MLIIVFADSDSCLNEEAAVPIHSLLLQLGDSDDTSQVNSGNRRTSGVSRRSSCRSFSAASSKSALSRRTSGGDEIAGESTVLEEKTMASNKNKPSSTSRKASGKTGLRIGKDFVTGFEAMQKIVDEYENAGNLQSDKFVDVREDCEDGFVQESRRKLLPSGSSGEDFVSDSKLPLLPNVQGPSYSKEHDSIVLIPDVFVKSPESSPTKEPFPPLTGDKTSKENIYKQNVAFMDDVKYGKARENIVEDLFGKRNDSSKPKSSLAVPKNLGMAKKPQKLTRNASASTKKSFSSVKMPNAGKKIEKLRCTGKGKKCKKELVGQKQKLKDRKPEEVNLEFLSLLPGFENCLNDDELKDMFVYECFASKTEVTSNGVQEVDATDISRPQPTECDLLPEKCSESPTFSCICPDQCNRLSKSLLDFYDNDLGQERPATGGRRSSIDFKFLGVSARHPELSIVNELPQESIFATEQGKFSDNGETDNWKECGAQGGNVNNCKGRPAREVLTSVSVYDEMSSIADGYIESQGHEGLTDSAELTTVVVQVESGAESDTKEKIELDLNCSNNLMEMTESTVSVQEVSDIESGRKEKMEDDQTKNITTVAVQEESDIESNLKENKEVDPNNNNNFREMTRIMFAPDIDGASSTGSGRRISNCGSIGRSSISTQTSTDGSEFGDEELYDWVKGNVLDQGAYGTVYLALTGRGKMVAVKQVVLSRTHSKESEKVRSVSLFVKLVGLLFYYQSKI